MRMRGSVASTPRRRCRCRACVRVFTGADIAKVCDPWVAVLAHLKGMKSAPQYALPLDRATWQGEALVAVVADSRAAAEDGVAALDVTFEPLPAQTDMETALAPGALVIHPDLGDNLAFQRTAEQGDVEAAFAAAHKVVEATLRQRPPYRRDAGAALDHRRLQPRRRHADRASLDPGAAHDAGRLRQAAAAWRRAASASSARMSAAPSASRCMSIPTRSRSPRCRASWAAR